MIDAERMLGSLVREAMGGGKKRKKQKRGRRKRRQSSMLSGLDKGKLGLGALGLAIVAYEQFAQKSQSKSAVATGSAPPPEPSSSAPLPPLPTPSAAPPDLPPLPVPPPTSAGDAAAVDRTSEATLLIRAMIAAANADHELDDAERQRILGAIDEGADGDGERAFLTAELDAPIALRDLVAAVAGNRDLARQVYLASRMAIDVDTAAEENYLAKLATQLGLDAAEVDELVAMIEVDDEMAPD